MERKYHNKTLELVKDFIKSKKRTYPTEIIRLGTYRKKIDQHTLKAILDNLEREGSITKEKIGGMTVICWME